MPTEYRLFQKVFREPLGNDLRRGVKGSTYVITKIGRKWITVKSETTDREERFNMHTGYEYAGDYSSQGRYHVDEKAYKEEAGKKEIWSAFCRRITFSHPPKHLSLEQLKQILETLEDEN